jgi:hypothetical protein
MTGLDPVIHVSAASAWMAGLSPALAGTKFLLPPAVSKKPREAMTIEWIELVVFMA